METLKSAVMGNMPFYILSAVAVVMLIASFIIPPTGVIDPSVLKAVAEILAFCALGAIIRAVDSGMSAKLTKGDTTIEIEK